MKDLTTKEAAARLGYASDASIRKLIERGQLKNAKRFGNSWSIPVKELENVERVIKHRKRKTS